MPTKVIKIGSEATEHHKKVDAKIMRIPTTAEDDFLQYFSSQMLGFPTPDIQIQTQKTPEKVGWKQAWTNTSLLVLSTQ